jgi:hypothetical protein
MGGFKIKLRVFKGLFFLIILIYSSGCSKNLYIRTIERGYKASKEDKTLVIKEDENFIYTKKKAKYTVYENQHFLVLKEDKNTGEISLYLALKYRGEDWIYMRGLEFNLPEGDYQIDFFTRKLNSALWRDKSNLVDSIEEYIAFSLTPQEISKFEEFLEASNREIRYISEVPDKGASVTLTEEEVANMRDILSLYHAKVKSFEENKEEVNNSSESTSNDLEN